MKIEEINSQNPAFDKEEDESWCEDCNRYEYDCECSYINPILDQIWYLCGRTQHIVVKESNSVAYIICPDLSNFEVSFDKFEPLLTQITEFDKLDLIRKMLPDEFLEFEVYVLKVK